MTKKDLVSICMPIYNGANYVHSSVNSILAQSHQNIELIVVDDGSTDETVEVLKGIKDSRLRLIENADNKGNLTRRNQAFEAAHGAYIAIMDADDICRSDRVERQMACLQNGYDLCGSWVAAGDSPALVKSVWRMPQQGAQLVRSTLFGSPFANPSVMMTRDLLEKSNFRFDLNYFPAADYEAWATKIFEERVKAFVVEAPLVFRRHHEASITTRHAERMAKRADEVRAKLLKSVGVSARLIKLHNKALATKVTQDEFAELRVLFESVLPKKIPESFSHGSVFFKNNNQTIRLGPPPVPKSKPKPKVSVIVPAYNVEEFIEQCVLSVVETCSEKIEVIIVNDGSTDNTAVIIADLKKRFPKTVSIVTQKNGGLSRARNAGVAHSQADFVYFLDGDDFLSPGAPDRVYKEAIRTSADIVVSTHSAYYEASGVTEPRTHIKKNELFERDVFEAFCDRKFGYIAANKLIRRTLANEVGFTPGLYHEDELYCPELFLQAKRVANLSEEIYFYRQREGSITSGVTTKHVEDWLVISERVFKLGMQYGLSTTTSQGFSKLLNYLLVAARRKLDRIEDCDPRFRSKVHYTVSALEERVIRSFGFSGNRPAQTGPQGEAASHSVMSHQELAELNSIKEALIMLNSAIMTEQHNIADQELSNTPRDTQQTTGFVTKICRIFSADRPNSENS